MTTGLVVSLKPLQGAFGLRTVMMTSMQAVSGARRRVGVLALDILDNVISYIPEEATGTKTRKTRVAMEFLDGDR